MMAKVRVIGAGNVGATCANALLHMKFCSEIVLLDIKEGVAEGKALDMMQTANLYQFNSKVIGVTNDYAATANSDVVVVTSGLMALGEKEELKKKIMDLLGITRQTYFSTILNNGISNISKAKYDDITLLFNEYSITDIWEVK